MRSSILLATTLLLVLTACTAARPDGSSSSAAPAATREAPSAPAATAREAPTTTEPSAAPRTGLAKLAFLIGAWVDEDPKQGVTVEETWSPALGGTMLGFGRTVVDGRTAHYEFLVIEERGDEIIYLAEPKGGVSTPFSLSTSGPDLAVFASVYDEFPHRIIYRRQGDRLTSRLEGVRNGRPVVAEWAYRLR